MKNILLFAMVSLFSISAFGQQTIQIGGETISASGIEFTTPLTATVNCDTIKSIGNQNDFPGGIAWVGDELWTSSYYSDIFTKYDFDGNIVGTFPKPSSYTLGGFFYNGEVVWAVSEQERTLYKLNAQTGAEEDQYILPSPNGFDPNNAGVIQIGDELWITHYDPDLLYKLQAETGEILDTIELSHRAFGMLDNGGQILMMGGFNENGIEQIYSFDSVLEITVDSADFCDNYTFNYVTRDDNDDVWAQSSGSYAPDLKIYQFSAESFPFITNTRNLEEEFFNSIVIYPNPTHDVFTIDTPDLEAVQIINAWGQNLNPGRVGNTIDLSDQVPGIYFALIKAGGKEGVRKIIKM